MSAKKKQIEEDDDFEDQDEQEEEKQPTDVNNTVLYDLLNIKKSAT